MFTEEHWNLLGFLFVIIALYIFCLCKNFIVKNFGMETFIFIVLFLVTFMIYRISRFVDMSNSVYALIN